MSPVSVAGGDHLVCTRREGQTWYAPSKFALRGVFGGIRAHRAPRADVRSILPAMVLARTVLFAAALTAVNGARLMFADSSTGTWGALPRAGTWQSASMTNGRTSNSSHPTVLCPVGSQVAFKWRNSPNLGARRGTGIRDLVEMASAQHYDDCNFADSQTIVAPNASTSPRVHYLPCSTVGSVHHLSCSVGTDDDGSETISENLPPGLSAEEASTPSQCAEGARVRVQVVAPLSALPAQTSLGALMALMGSAAAAASPHDLGPEGLIFGFDTETVASATLELLRSLLPACPTSALDFDPSATNASCRATVHVLTAIVEHGRPASRSAAASSVLQEALHLATPGSWASCFAQSQRYLAASDDADARVQATALCSM